MNGEMSIFHARYQGTWVSLMKINSEVKIRFLCSCLHVLDLINVELGNTLLSFPLVREESVPWLFSYESISCIMRMQ